MRLLGEGKVDVAHVCFGCAAARELKESTIYGHLAQAVEAGVLTLAGLPGMPPAEEIEHIRATWQQLSPEEQQQQENHNCIFVQFSTLGTSGKFCFLFSSGKSIYVN